LARRMVAPIRTLQEGAARIGAGDLAHRIAVETGDELQALADEFNRSTARLQESYEGLERKVGLRTAELAQMDKIFPYTLALDSKRERLLWAWGWCATSTAILNENYKHIQLEFSINGEAVDPASFYEFQQQGGGLFCKSYYIVVYNWPSGETKLQTVVTFDAPINDGINAADFPQGVHEYKYIVRLP